GVASVMTEGGGYGVVDLGVINVDPNISATTAISLLPTDYTNSDAFLLSETPWSNDTSNMHHMMVNRVLVMPEESSQIVLDNSRRRSLLDYYAVTGNVASQALPGWSTAALWLASAGLVVRVNGIEPPNASISMDPPGLAGVQEIDFSSWTSLGD